MPLNKLADTGQPLPLPDLQRTTFAIDGIARFVCNTWSEIQAAQMGGPFDVVVIGSGMYGAYCATKIFEFTQTAAVKPRILVLEAGPFLISEHFQNMTRIGGLFGVTLEPIVESDRAQFTEPNYANSGQFVQHHKCVGGKSLFWGGWTPRLTEADLNQWPDDVRDYLLQTGQPDGYEFVEREIGAVPAADFINGELFDIIKQKASSVLGENERLTAVEDAPIAVLGQSPGSGLFSLDKFSSLPLLLDNIRQDNDQTNANNNARRLFLVPNAEVLKLETVNGVVTEIVVALKNQFADNPKDTTQAQVVRLPLQPSASVILAGNTINSTRLALNSFPRPAALAPNGELMGRNLMAHVRGNFVWKVKRDLLGVPDQLKTELQTAALNIRGKTNTPAGEGQFHFQFYAAPNMNTPAFPGAANNPEEFLYRMVPNFEELDKILEAQTSGPISDRIVIGIRTCGEMFGDKTAAVGNTNSPTSWMNVNPFGGTGDDLYFENGQELRVPKAFVRFVETPADKKVREDQSGSAFKFISTLAGQPLASAADTNPNGNIQYFDPDRETSDEDGIGTTYHECGSLWMGRDFRNSVTDVNGRFHHIYNAYCADQALFPTAGSANPVPTGLALARKVARSIVERYQPAMPSTDEAGFQPLYTGNYAVDGWQYVGGQFDGQIPFFDVNGEQPILSAGIENPGFNSVLGVLWYTPTSFRDFVLKLEWKSFDITANSGIFLRIPRPLILDSDNFYNSSIEVQIDERGLQFSPANSVYGSPFHRTGAVYEVFPAQQWAAKQISSRAGNGRDFWNSYEIRLEGNQIEVKLNDQLVSQGTFPELQPPGQSNAPNTNGTKRSDGFIGLQCHTEVVQFRNIRIRPL